jgi:DNA-binding winged helix-turn-helix (wHTH) protein/tetratricopeptide (TPR) repeat protein
VSVIPRSVYGFGAYHLDPVNRLLLRDGTRVSIKPKTFEMLLLLVEGRGDVLTKDQLMRTLWPDTFVEEANLAQHVATLRKVLGGNGTRHYIETVPKQGYRFAAPVDIIVSDRAQSTVPRPSLAVLPLGLFGVEGTDAFLSLGVADTLITKLGKSTRVAVRSTSAIAKYENFQDAVQIGRLLTVDFVLTGRLYKQGESFHLNLQLVRTADGTTAWTEQFKLSCANVFAVENSVIRNVERALLPAVRETKPKRKRPTRSGAAYQCYLKGRYFWNKRSEADLQKAITCFHEAIAIDENYALAYAGIADSFLMLVNYGAMSSKQGLASARAATLKALEADPELGEAHASLGYLKSTEWDWDGCETEFLRSIELNPTDVTPRHWYAALLTIQGRWDQALEELQKAREIDPLSLILGATTGWLLWQMRRYDDARIEILRSLDLEQEYYPAHLYLARVNLLQGRTDEAIAEFEKAFALSNHITIRAELAHAQTMSGLPGPALELVNELLERAENGHPPPCFYLALMYAGLGKKECALQALQNAYQEGELWMLWCRNEPRFDPLRDDVRFIEVLRSINLTAQHST